jgi:hypothetical protein
MVGMGMVAWGLNIQELRQAISEVKGRRRQRRKASACILIFIAQPTPFFAMHTKIKLLEPAK